MEFVSLLRKYAALYDSVDHEDLVRMISRGQGGLNDEFFEKINELGALVSQHSIVKKIIEIMNRASQRISDLDVQRTDNSELIAALRDATSRLDAIKSEQLVDLPQFPEFPISESLGQLRSQLIDSILDQKIQSNPDIETAVLSETLDVLKKSVEKLADYLSVKHPDFGFKTIEEARSIYDSAK